jgi:hypothetical protein
VLEPPDILGPLAMSESQVIIRVAIKTQPGRRATVARAYRHEVKGVLEESQIPISSPSSMMIVESDGKVLSMSAPSGDGSGSGSSQRTVSGGSAGSAGASGSAGSESDAGRDADDVPQFWSH